MSDDDGDGGALELSFPVPDRPLGSNEAHSMHWGAVSRRLDVWRQATAVAMLNARSQVEPFRDRRAQVIMHIPFARGGRRDPSNYVATVVKACVDVLVQHKLWPDDTPRWVNILEPKIVVGNTVTIRIIPYDTKKTLGTRAVLRTIDPGNGALCAHCNQPIKFVARDPRLKRMQVIANVYEDGAWVRVEHYHRAVCYEAAGMPYGEPQS